MLDRAADGGQLSNAELETEAEQALSEPATLRQLLAARFVAKRDSHFARADALRVRGIELEDTCDGVRWSRR